MTNSGTYRAGVLMAAAEDESKVGELADSSEVQVPDDAKALDVMITSLEEEIALCNVVFQDLLAVQKIVKEKGLCDAVFQEQKNQSDFTL